jgi:hypothetical protein
VEAVLRGHDHGSGVSAEAKLGAQTMFATNVTFVDALSAFLSAFFGKLKNDENKISCIGLMSFSVQHRPADVR